MSQTIQTKRAQKVQGGLIKYIFSHCLMFSGLSNFFETMAMNMAVYFAAWLGWLPES